MKILKYFPAMIVLAYGVLFGQTPVAQYRTHGPAKLNDLTWTPGATGTLPQATLCSPTFHTGTVRNVPESLKQQVCRDYGIAKADCTGQKVEIDHLISLELGGSNVAANLWPQPYFPKPGAKEKDVVENWLHRQVCTGKLPLAEAQHEIATDWYAVYLKVPPPNGGPSTQATADVLSPFHQSWLQSTITAEPTIAKNIQIANLNTDDSPCGPGILYDNKTCKLAITFSIKTR